MRLNGVEIKVSLSDRQVARALKVLELGGNGQPRRIGFIEDTTVGVELPLFQQGVVLRVRQTDGEDDDSTVKLRPCRRSQLAESWLGAEKGDGWKLRVEEDWAGSRRALAASCVTDLPPRRIAAAWEGKEPMGRLFNGGQWRFLSDCVGMPINLDARSPCSHRWRRLDGRRSGSRTSRTWSWSVGPSMSSTSSNSRSRRTPSRRLVRPRRNSSGPSELSSSNVMTSMRPRPSGCWPIWSA
jgi:hypothetical protein